MMRLARCTLNALTVLSLLLCVATSTLWVRSTRHCDRADAVTPGRYFLAKTYPGGVEWCTFPNGQNPPHPLRFRSDPYGVKNAFGAWLIPSSPNRTTLGFAMPPLRFSNRPGPEPRSADVFTPFWAILLAGLVLPAAAVARRRRHRRRTACGVCPACSYDLTGNVSGVCPECGSAIVKATP